MAPRARHDRRHRRPGPGSGSASSCRHGRCATAVVRHVAPDAVGSPRRSRRWASTRCGCPDHLQRDRVGRRRVRLLGVLDDPHGAAEATTRIGIGPFIACTGFRNPALLAKMAATLDEVSGGRLVLGLGSGVPERDESWRAFGYDGCAAGRQVRRGGRDRHPALRDGAAHVRGRALPGDARVIPRGPRAAGCRCSPPGVGERTAQVAARHADRINVNKTIATLPTRRRHGIARRRVRGGRARPGDARASRGGGAWRSTTTASRSRSPAAWRGSRPRSRPRSARSATRASRTSRCTRRRRRPEPAPRADRRLRSTGSRPFLEAIRGRLTGQPACHLRGRELRRRRPRVERRRVVGPFEAAGHRPWPGVAAAAQLARPTRTRARPASRRSSASTVARRAPARAGAAPTSSSRRRRRPQRLDRVGARVRRPTSRRARRPARAAGAGSRSSAAGRRSSDGVLSSTRGTTSSVSRSRSGW